MTDKEIGELFGIAAAATMFQTCAVVGALAEKQLIEPMKVAAWAKTFAGGFTEKLAPELRAGVAEHLNNFADLITAMATPPANAGRG